MTYFFSQLLQHHNKASRVDAKTFVLSPRKIRKSGKSRSSEISGLSKCAFKERTAKWWKQMFFSSNSKVSTKVKHRWTTTLETGRWVTNSVTCQEDGSRQFPRKHLHDCNYNETLCVCVNSSCCCYRPCNLLHRIIESLRLEKSYKIIWSNHPPTTNITH